MFHVGQMVECVDAGVPVGAEGRWDARLARGAIYTVRWCGVHVSRREGARFTVRLAEIVRDHKYHPDWPYKIERFRPLQDSKLEVFRALLVDLPALPKFEPTKERV